MTSEGETDVVSEHWLQMITHILQGLTHNSSIDLRKPHLRPVFFNNYWFFVFMYAILVVFGAMANIGVIVHVIRRGLYKDSLYCFMINLALSDFFKCTVVLPITLAALLIQNWVFGQFFCFFLPMMQDIPLHVSTLTFLLIAVDRYRFTKDPTSSRLSAFVCATSTWFFAVCIVLPYLFYITYIDLETYQPNFDGVGVCVFNLADDMQEYMRPLFLITYAAPMATIAYLYVKSSRELQLQEEPLTVLMYEPRTRHSSSIATTPPQTATPQHSYHRSSSTSTRRHCNREPELDVYREKRNQWYLASMVTTFAICLCPLMVLRLARLAVTETYDNTAHFDITYTILVWIGFVPTCSTPGFYAAWQMSRIAKERLRGYFRFSNRKLRQSCEQMNRGYGGEVGDGGSVVSYVHKTSNASSCQVEQLYSSS